MRRLLLQVLLITFILHSQAQLKGSSFADSKQSKNADLTYSYVGVNGFASESESGDIKGMFVDMMREFENYVLTTHGINVNSQWVKVDDDNFQEFLDGVKSAEGGVFGLGTTTIKEERKSFLKFSPPVLNNISVLISHKNVSTLSSIDNISKEFSALNAYTTPGSTYETRMNDLKSGPMPSLNVIDVASEYAIIESISNDENSFGFIDISYYLEYLRNRKPVKRHPVGDLGGEEYGITMPLNSDWDAVLGDFFVENGFLKSAKYRQIVIDNLGRGALRMLGE